MRAVVHDRYGPPQVLRLDDVERPEPEDDEVLIRIHAATVNRTDCGLRHPRPAFARVGMKLLGLGGLLRPTRNVLGSELAGEVEAVGAAVSGFAVGDEVFGINAGALGAHAEYVCMSESAALARKPAGMSFEQAAAVCDGAILALTCLRQTDIQKGRSVLVYGASGSIGTASVQLARYFDATVTAVCNTKNLALVGALGADEVIDYTQQDFTTTGKTYDIIIDAVGKLSFGRCKRSLKRRGVYLPTDGVANLVLALATKRTRGKRVRFSVPPRYTQTDVLFLKELLEEGKYRAVIDRTYPLEDVVEATRYVETEQKTGNVVLTVGRGRA